jgi:hypothetical protein
MELLQIIGKTILHSNVKGRPDETPAFSVSDVSKRAKKPPERFLIGGAIQGASTIPLLLATL